MYRLTGRLEDGQLADLFRAERLDRREHVVVKLFHPNTSDEAYAEVIARLSSSLTHEGVARVLELGMVEDRLAIVREDTGPYSLGLALSRLHTREVLLPPTLALAMTLELLAVVGAAHEAGVVHGALTPGNVLLGADGRVSVADFGALEALRAAPTLLRSFGSRGRSSYRAPELGAGDAPTVAGDVYALGAIVDELLTLREASLGSTAVSTREARLPPPSRLVRRLHSRIDGVIMRALESAPGRRQKSCGEFAEGLRDFLASSGGIPPRGDVAKFVGELFPNEVQLAAGGAVPFTTPFTLRELSSVHASEVEVTARRSFSGGAVDERTPTSDGLPVFGESAAAPTQPSVPALPARPPPTDWEAPPAADPTVAAPAASPSAPAGGALKQRLKVVEDFAPEPDASKRAAARPKPPLRQRVAKTLVTFAVPFKRPGDPSIPDYAELERRGRRTVRVVSFIGMLAMFTSVGAVLYVSFGHRHWKETLVSYLPAPLQRVIPVERRAVPPPRGPAPKLQDFDAAHPDKAFRPEGEAPPARPVAEKAPPAREAVPPPQALPGRCHQPPREQGAAQLEIRTPRKVRVSIDGRPVCTPPAKIAVVPGRRRVEIVELKTRREYVSVETFLPGKTVTLTPIFSKR